MNKYNVGDSVFVGCFHREKQKYVARKGKVLSVNTSNGGSCYYDIEVNGETRSFMEFGVFTNTEDCNNNIN